MSARLQTIACAGGSTGAARARRCRRALAAIASLAVLVPLGGCATLMDSLETVSASETSTPADGLREALKVGTARAVDSLGRVDGYLGRPEVRLEVPEKLEPLARALRTLGRGDLVDEFQTSINRAAEAAVPVARDVFLASIREMTFGDAMAILRGSGHEATDYFREHAGPRLAERFRPIVDDKLETVGATRKFNDLMDDLRRVPLVERPVFDLGEHVTSEALRGLFLTLEREEEKIRRDPAARSTALLRKWFGARVE